MRGYCPISLAALAGLLAAQPVAARDERLVLAPSTAWTLDYADDSCALRREFGGADNPVLLQMQQFAPGRQDIQFQVVARDLSWKSIRQAWRARVRLLPDEASSAAGAAYNITAAENLRGIAFSNWLLDPALDPRAVTPEAWAEATSLPAIAARESTIVGLELDDAFEKDIVLQTGSLGAPMAAMRDCLDELLTHWGIDAEAHRTLSRPVGIEGDTSWVDAVRDAYPSMMAHRRQEAVLRIRLDISTEGRVTGCHLQQRLGNEVFEQTACAILLEQAQFTPALDAAGTPIASYHVFAIYYDIY